MIAALGSGTVRPILKIGGEDAELSLLPLIGRELREYRTSDNGQGESASLIDALDNVLLIVTKPGNAFVSKHIAEQSNGEQCLFTCEMEGPTFVMPCLLSYASA